MSQQEFERADAQVIEMVENHANPNTKKAMSAIATMAIAEREDAEHALELRRQILWTVLQVLSCILVAALFVVALMEPGFVVHLVNVGVLACGIVAAVLIDRKVRNREGD